MEAGSCFITPLHCNKTETRNQTMTTARLMKTFDRAALTFFMILAATPVLALVAAGSIH